MTQTLHSQPDSFAAAFDALRRTSAEPARLAGQRRQAFDYFQSAGFPTAGDEAWRFTDLRPITQTRFAPAPHARISHADLARFDLDGRAPLIVFVNGRLHRALSRLGDLPAGVEVRDLAQAVTSADESWLAHLGTIAPAADDPFTALNLALAGDALIIRIGKGVHVQRPIHLLSIAAPAAANQEPFVTHPRFLVLAEPGSSAAVVERYVALSPDKVSGGGGDYWTNAVTEIRVGENAQVTHYLLEEESPRARNISTLAVHQERDSRFTSHSALFGGQLVRNNVHVALRGPGCQSLINGLFIGHDSQTLDNHMRVLHASPQGESRQFYNGVLDGKSRGVFTGCIVVAPDAQKTDAKQTNRNLLLSDDARIDTQPQLEIYADDVKCTHGATTGRLDADMLFYLRSRGLDAQAARALLIYAFAHESLDRMPDLPVRAHLGRLLLEKLPHGPAVARTLGGLPAHESFVTQGDQP